MVFNLVFLLFVRDSTYISQHSSERARLSLLSAIQFAWAARMSDRTTNNGIYRTARRVICIVAELVMGARRQKAAAPEPVYRMCTKGAHARRNFLFSSAVKLIWHSEMNEKKKKKGRPR